MKKLFFAAFKNKHHRFLVCFTIFAMCLLTVASQLEVLALGVITKKGPDFFELFGPVKEGVIQSADEVSKSAMEARWDQIVPVGSDMLTREDTKQFFLRMKSNDVIQQVINWMDGVFPISGNMKNLAIALILVALFKAVMLFAYRFATRILAIKVSRDLRLEYFEHIQSLPMEFYQKYNIGSLSSRVVGDSTMIGEAVTAVLVNYLQTPFTVISTLTLCFFTSWQLSLIIFFGLPAIIVPVFYIAGKVRKISRQIQQNQEEFASVLIDFLSGIQTIKVFAMEDFSLKKYKERNLMMANLEKKSARYDLASRPVVHTIGMSFLSIALLWGLYVLKMSISEAFFFIGLLYVFYEPLKKFAEENSHIQRGVAASDRMYEVLSVEPKIVDMKGAEELTGFKGPIEFDGVGFRYGDEWILKDLNFTVEKGQTVAIVGPTGAGKSTIVQLIPRLYEVQEGEIRINNKPIQNYTQKSLREILAFVPQKPFIFLDTVSENIAFGRPFTEDQIISAAKKAHAHEFVARLPKGYQTELLESGKNLSGGQQQRLAIARALVKEAPILIMDEATSSLDTISENYIKMAIKELRGQVTQIIIAHRLTTIEDADKIIYLEEGQKIAEGTKDELLVSCSGFRRMWEAMHRPTSGR